MNKTQIQKRQICFLLSLFFWSLYGYGQADLFISEYVEGSSNNKCIEIFNPTSEAVDLAIYDLEIYNNGDFSSGKISNLKERTGISSLNPKRTIVLCSSLADIGLKSISNGFFNVDSYNGNDAITLSKNGQVIDIIGQIGCDPGSSGWNVNGNSTVDNTLIRIPCVVSGNTADDCSFNSLGTEWTSIGFDNFSNIGEHNSGFQEVTISGDNALCERPSITLSATEGFTTYRWSNGANSSSTTINTPGTYRVTVTSEEGCEAEATKTINGQSPAITATISNIQPVSCLPKKDGGFTINPSGGSGGFSYAWETGGSTSNIINGIGAGNYQVTITDSNGCSLTKPVEITGSVTVPLTVDIIGESCEGRGDGQITLSAAGNGLIYAIEDNAFQQSNLFTDLAPGDYLVQVQDNSGCGDQQRVVIEEGTDFDLRNSRVSQEPCQGIGDGSQIILAPEGGMAPYQISFDGNPFTTRKIYSNLTAGIFDIVIRDASGCEKTFQQEILEGSDVSIANYEVFPATCEGVIDGGIQIKLAGGSDNIGIDILRESDGFPLVFNPNKPLANGEHELVIRDFEFDCKIPFKVTIPVKRTLMTAISTMVSCEEEPRGSININPLNGVGPYQFSLGDDEFVTDNIFQDLVIQPYILTTKDNEGCERVDSIDFEEVSDFEIVFAVPRATACPETEDGQITIVTNRTEEVLYSVDGINYNENHVFSGLPAGEYVAYAQLGDCMATKAVTIPEAEAITLEQVTTQIALCEGENDGQLMVTVTGGTAPYNYQLDQDTFQTSPVFTNLLQGTYTLTVKDSNQCAQVFTDIVLPGPVRLDLECRVTQHVSSIDGADGQVRLVIFGGAAPYNVQLVDAGFNNIISLDGFVDFTNLAAGDYEIEVVDDNGCRSTCNFTIEAPECDFKLTSDATNMSCFNISDGSISLTIPMDHPPFTINWSDTAYNGQQDLLDLSAGTYEVTVTDAIGCVDSTTIIITQPDSLFVTIETDNTTICANDSTALIVPETYVRYVWSNGDSAALTTVTQSGNYEVRAYDEMGCHTTNEIEITVWAQDTITETRVTCDVADTGMFILEERDENGCNDIILRTYELARKDTTYLKETTCNPMEIGIFENRLANIFGCDSLIITTIELLRIDTTNQIVRSCDRTAAGIEETLLVNQFGCDSLVVRTTISSISEPTQTTKTTCEATAVGVDSILLMNQFGCDSLVVIATNLSPNDSISFTQETCNPQDTGSVIQVLTNQFGCDSIITTITNLRSIDDCQISFLAIADTICADEIVGTIQIIITTGASPYNYYLLDDFYKDTLQSGTIINVETILENIPVGQYSLTITNENGVQNTQRLSITQLSPLIIEAQLSDYNGFAVSCIDETDGSIDLTVTGGQMPYTYLWEGNQTIQNRELLASGNYEVTVTDAQNCSTSAAFQLLTNEELGVEVTTLNLSCQEEENRGQIIVYDLPNANGDTDYSLDGNIFQPIDQLPFTIENLPMGDYQLFIQDENDCQVSTSITIPIGNDLQLTLGDSQNLSLGDSLVLVPQANFTITHFEWTATVPITCSDCTTIQTIPNQDGTYTLTAYDINGCSVTASSTIQIKKESPVYMPNIFSPNDDGVNDRYQIFTNNSVSRIHQLQVYDYEGRLMYQVNNRLPNDASIGWDGQFNGQKMLPGVFVVLLEVELIDGNWRQFTQTMTLVE